MHQVECMVDLLHGHGLSSEFVDHELSGQIFINQLGNRFPALPATESGALPHAASDKLEWTCGNLLAGCSNSDDDGRAPAFVA